MGDDIELIAQLIQEFASLIRFPHIQDITDMYILTKNVYDRLLSRNETLWGSDKRRAMAYIIPMVHAYLIKNNGCFVDCIRMIRKEHDLLQGSEYSRYLYALTPIIENGDLDRLYESMKRGNDMFKEITSLQSRSNRKHNGLPITLSMNRDEFLRRYSVLPPPVLVGFAMSLHMRDRDMNVLNTIRSNRLECIGGDPIIYALPSDMYWWPASQINHKIVPQNNLASWSSLRASWEATKETVALLETNIRGESRSELKDRRVVKRKSGSLSESEND
jgi:hypothetical protein